MTNTPDTSKDTIYITQEGDMVDAICWKHYGYSSGTFEKVLEANYGLADYGPILPAGVRVILPAITTIETQPFWE